jgi:hypothetical protein
MKATTASFLLLGALALSAGAADGSPSKAQADARAAIERAGKAKGPGFAIDYGRPHRVQASLAFAGGGSKVSADEWFVFAALPPDLPGQRLFSFKALPDGTASKVLEPVGLKQPVLVWRVPGEGDRRQVVGVSVEYTVELIPRSLRALTRDEKPPEVADLPAEQRTAFTAPTPLLDFVAPAFQEWLGTNALRPADGETDIDLARRIFLHLKEKSGFAYAAEMDRRASAVCKSMKSDCGGLTATFVAALRANAIPARQLVGRWATSAKADEKLYGKPWQQEHVQSEFWATGVGWVIVDLSVAVDYDKKPGSLDHFGNERGRFVAFHVDADVTLDVPKIGRRTIQFLQEPAYFFVGKGTLAGDVTRSDWVVKPAPRR